MELKTYILGSQKIQTTEERYERVFKDMGYKPYIEKKAVVVEPKAEKVAPKKSSKKKQTNSK